MIAARWASIAVSAEPVRQSRPPLKLMQIRHRKGCLRGVESTTAPTISATKTMAIQTAGFMQRFLYSSYSWLRSALGRAAAYGNTHGPAPTIHRVSPHSALTAPTSSNLRNIPHRSDLEFVLASHM